MQEYNTPGNILNANLTAIQTPAEPAITHKILLTYAFYNFLKGLENYLTYFRNQPGASLNGTVPLQRPNNPRAEYNTRADYNKYLKYKTKYMELKRRLKM
jgi:hypothetical protein